MLLVFIFFCREQCWRSGIVVSVVVNIITLVFSYSVNSYIVPFFSFLFRISFGVMMPSFNTLFIVQMTNQKQGQQGQLGQHFSLSRPRTCADESIESAVLAVPSYHHDVMSFSLDSLDFCRRQGCNYLLLALLARSKLSQLITAHIV